MPFKDSVNRILQRVTGYRVTHETPDARRQAIADAKRRGARRARRLAEESHRRKAATRKMRQAAKIERLRDRHAAQLQRLRQDQAAQLERIEAERQERLRREQDRQVEQERARVAAAKRQEEARARGDDLPKHIDAATKDIIVRVRPRTMTQHQELTALVEAIRYLERVGVPGEIVECGVWRGGSMQAAALTLLGLGSTGRELHLFDTFEGMPPPSSVDVRVMDGQTAEALMAVSDKDARIWAYAGIDDVRQAMAEVDYPADKVFFHQGLVEETVPDQAPEQIALLRLDTDWYESTRHELVHLYDRLSPGGVLIIDDYRAWEGSGRATDEWIAQRGEPIFLAPMAAGRIAIKPR